ncbi:MAG: hypothetical protein LBJ94_00705 [Puniceicoccales bacterium]|jgi:hypothetical protein|nr:hypothetical protein [Puniceicoccales bacterium]
MDSFESSCRGLVKQPNFWLKIFIGVLLAAIPFANILAFGYIIRAIEENGPEDDFFLPAWDLSSKNLRQNLWLGINGLVLLLVFLGGPVLIGYLIGLGFSWVSDSVQLFLAYCGLLVGAPTAVYAMLHIVNMNELMSRRVVWIMFSRTINTRWRVIMPSFLFLCIVLLGVQLLPLAALGAPIFFGLIFMVAFMRGLKIMER